MIFIHKSNGIITIKKSIKKTDILKIKKNYRYLEQNVPKNWAEARVKNINKELRSFPFWHQMGKIDIIMKLTEFSIFNGLNIEEIDQVIKTITLTIPEKQ
ncbi:hypothetical protein [Flavobacterium sp. J27]|uniref:hypothetical protein n=1 Tax=Flavobacterium sp. J27 TaxID=2060419 RepID=UPI001030F04B|nr:hypothetical protein [Flavobacterium sp. J27]